MDLRVVIHRSLTIAIAALFSLVPVAGLVAALWPRLLVHLKPHEILGLLATTGIVALLVPITRDVAERLLDRYVYRKQANYQRTVRDASGVLTRALEIGPLLQFVSTTLASVTESEGVVIYVNRGRRLTKALPEACRPGARFEAPDHFPGAVLGALASKADTLIADKISREQSTDASKDLRDELKRRNWALVLPAVSENMVIAAIALGPKLSGDPFYPHDLDLLMTLANQAGTAIKNAQLYAEVILANQYLHNIVATINSGVIAIDAMGDVTMFNPTAEELTGLRNVPVHERGVGALPAVLRDALLATVQNGIARTHPEIELSDGATTRPIMCTTSPLRDRGDRVLGAVAVFSDLTPVRDLEAERRRAERAVYLETIASGIAHEVKNPLVAIKTFAQLLDRRRNDERFINDFSRVVIRQIDRMERLVERLRSLTRPAPRELRRVDVRVPVTETLEFLQGSFEDKRLALDVSVPDKELPVLGDHSELEQLFLNLLINAHEATPAGGRITVRLGVADDRAVVDVADTGPGIAPDILDRMFDPFVTTKPTGSGLGLTVCARIAAAHGARLRGANTAGGGACFTVEFPLTATVGVTTR